MEEKEQHTKKENVYILNKMELRSRAERIYKKRTLEKSCLGTVHGHPGQRLQL